MLKSKTSKVLPKKPIQSQPKPITKAESSDKAAKENKIIKDTLIINVEAKKSLFEEKSILAIYAQIFQYLSANELARMKRVNKSFLQTICNLKIILTL